MVASTHGGSSSGLDDAQQRVAGFRASPDAPTPVIRGSGASTSSGTSPVGVHAATVGACLGTAERPRATTESRIVHVASSTMASAAGGRGLGKGGEVGHPVRRRRSGRQGRRRARRRGLSGADDFTGEVNWVEIDVAEAAEDRRPPDLHRRNACGSRWPDSRQAILTGDGGARVESAPAGLRTYVVTAPPAGSTTYQSRSTPWPLVSPAASSEAK